MGRRPEPFLGVKVLDLTQNAVGQAMTSTLGDLGASMTSVGRPGFGSSRQFSRRISVGRNKRSVVLDLKHEAGREVFGRLVARTDVLVEGFRPGVTRRLGIDFEHLSTNHPRLIYCSISGYGQTGPYRDRPGHDLNFQGMAGALRFDDGGVPQMPSNIWADRCASLNAGFAIATALFERERTGIGAWIDLAIVESMVTLPYADARDHPGVDRILNGGPPGSESELTPFQAGDYPCYQIYRCGDGRYLTLCCNEPWFWSSFCEIIGRPEWEADHRPSPERSSEIISELHELFLSKPVAAWLEELIDLPVAEVNRDSEVGADDQLRSRRAVFDVNVGDGPSRLQMAPPFRFDSHSFSVESPIVMVGEHTRAVLHDLGYADAEIDQLTEWGVIAQGEPVAPAASPRVVP